MSALGAKLGVHETGGRPLSPTEYERKRDELMNRTGFVGGSIA